MAKSQKSGMPWSEIGAASLGVAVGGVLGMLFSPASGKKNRATVAKEGRKVVKSVSSAVKKVERVGRKVARKAGARAKRK